MARSTERRRPNRTTDSDNSNVTVENKLKDCNDVFFLLIFLACVIMTAVFAFQYGQDFINKVKFVDTSDISGLHAILNYVFYAGLIGLGLSLGMTLILMFAGECMIWTALILIIVLNLGIAFFYSKFLHDQGHDVYYWPAVVFGALALLTAVYAFFVRKRVKFAAKHLKVAGSAIMTLPMMVVVAFVMVFVQLGWVFLWFLGNIGILFKSGYITPPEECIDGNCEIKTELGKGFGIFIGMLLIFFWTAFVIINIVHVTVAGGVASWKIKSGAPMITLRSWFRAVTFSLGSICFGSLIVAILETIKQVIRGFAYMAGKSGNCIASCLLSCLECIIGCIESLVKYFNRYAYTYVGVYGYSFLTAGKHVFALFNGKGWSAIVNDNLTGNVFFLAQLMVGGLTAFISVELVDKAKDGTFQGVSEPDVIIGLLGFLIGYAVCTVFMSVFESAVTTVFVLWCEDPHGWQLAHPDHYASLHAAWLEIYPQEYNDGHGKSGGYTSDV